jgi:hypothetical protein
MKQNDFQVQYDVSRWFGVRAGFDWDNYTIQPGNSSQTALGDIYYPTLPNRGNCAGLPLNPDGSCTLIGVIAPWGNPTTEINDYSGVLGVWFRKGSTLHANLNAKFGGADNWIYRIDPLASLNISGNISYSPHPWLTVGANLKFQQGKNNVSDINYNQHNYSTVLNAMINPNKYWGLDVAYNFDAIQQNMFLCFAGTVTPADTTTCAEDPTLLADLRLLPHPYSVRLLRVDAYSCPASDHASGLHHGRQPGQYYVAEYAATVGAALVDVSVATGGRRGRRS